MDQGGNHQNGRHRPDMYKPAHSQWLMQQPQSMKHIMSIMAERDAAIQERNMAIKEKNKVCEERDLAILQRDKAIQERNEAIVERDNARSAVHFQHDSANGNDSSPPLGQSQGVKHMHHHPQDVKHSPKEDDASFDGKDVSVVENVNSRKVKRLKDPDALSPKKKTANCGWKGKREGGDLNKIMLPKAQEWKGLQDIGSNQVAFDESSMPPPVCSCTGVYRQCYKWGNGGWQSSCCTTTMSMYPLPAMPNKKHGRVGGRKMSGSAFGKLLSRMAGEGHDLSTPIDLKDNWAKHGTNRYITIK